MKKLAVAFLLAACNSPKPAPVAAAPVAAAPVAAAPAAAGAQVASEEPPISIGTKMKCAVTGEDFTVSAKTVQIVYQGKRYAFCCADCLPEFNKNPAKFARN
jgi:YHS domain-containing protein